MKMTKTRIKELIREELASMSMTEGEDMDPEGKYPVPKQKSSVTRATQKMEKAAGLQDVIKDVNNRPALEQFLGNVVGMLSDQLSAQDVYVALVKTSKAVKAAAEE